MFRVCLIFYTYDSANFKSIGNNTNTKKCYLATALALLITGCAQQTFTVQNKTGSSSTKGNHHPSFLRFWNWAEEKLSRQPKFVAAQKNVVKTETRKHSNGLLGFITLGIYTSAGSACVLLTIIA